MSYALSVNPTINYELLITRGVKIRNDVTSKLH